jgi:tryptophan synthase alpha chain
VARAGVTGADRQLQLDHQALFAKLEAVGAPPPILGFGIAKAAHVEEALAHGAAGAVSGSAIVDLIARGVPPGEVAAFVAQLKAATACQRLDFASAAL